MSPLDILTLLALIAINADILFQIKRIYNTKSSQDLSLLGMGIRYTAIMMLLIKFIDLGDTALLVGHGLIALTFTLYFGLAVYYFAHRKNSNQA